MTLSQTLIARIDLQLRQRLALNAGLMSSPITDLDRIIEKVIENPEIAEPGQETNTATGRPNAYASLQALVSRFETKQPEGASKKTNDSRSSLIIPSVDLARVEQPKTGTLNPDVTYVAHGYGDVSIRAANHFRAYTPRMELVQLPVHARAVLTQLIRNRNWMVQVLAECYKSIADKQAGFLYSLDLGQLNMFTLDRLGFEVGRDYNISTYSRLLQNRTIAIESDNGHATIPIRFLLPDRDNIIAYGIIPKLNRCLEAELEKGVPCSDDQIARMTGTGIATRTVAKYRQQAGIPDKQGRLAEYLLGRTEPYKIVPAIDLYIERAQHINT